MRLKLCMVGIVCGLVWNTDSVARDNLPRDIKHETIPIPQEIRELAHMSRDSMSLLKWFFCSSREWQVLEYRGAWLVKERKIQGELPGTDSSKEDAVLRIQMGSWLYGQDPAWKHSTTANGNEESIDLPVCLDEYGSLRFLWRSALILRFIPSEGPLFVITIEEASLSVSREGTRSKLQKLAEVVAMVNKGREMVEATLLADKSMILDSGETSISSVHLLNDDWGEHDVEGYANAGEMGYLQVTYSTDEVTWHGSDPSEWIGWDKDMSKKFFFRVHVDDRVPGNGSDCDIIYRFRFFPEHVRTLFVTNGVVKTRVGR